MKEIIIGIVIGGIVGCYQALNDFTPGLSRQLPFESSVTLSVFAALAGIVIALRCLGYMDAKEKSLGIFFFFMTCSLTIGLPNIIKYYDGSLFQSATMIGLFFSLVGLAMAVVGATSYLLKNALNKSV